MSPCILPGKSCDHVAMCCLGQRLLQHLYIITSADVSVREYSCLMAPFSHLQTTLGQECEAETTLLRHIFQSK